MIDLIPAQELLQHDRLTGRNGITREVADVFVSVQVYVAFYDGSRETFGIGERLQVNREAVIA